MPNQSNVCFLELIKPGNFGHPGVGYGMAYCEARSGPEEMTLGWIKQAFAKNKISRDEACSFVTKFITSDQGKFDEVWGDESECTQVQLAEKVDALRQLL